MWRRILLIAAGFVVLGLCFGSGLLAGLIGGNRQAYHGRYLEEREAVAPILATDPAFAGVELCERSNGGVYLIGAVPGRTDLDRLRERVSRAVGEPRCREVLLGVRARE